MWILDIDDMPSAASLSDGDSSLDSDDFSVASCATFVKAPGGASFSPPCPPSSPTTPYKPPHRRSKRLRKLTPSSCPRHSRRFQGEAVGPMRLHYGAATNYCFAVSIEALVFSWLYSLVLVYKTASTIGDNPNWKQAMTGPVADKYWDAACVEVESLDILRP